MAFRLKKSESLKKAIQRVAREQVDDAIKELKDDSLGPHEAVHQFRKHCKKMRGLLRLVRPAMEKTYQRENEWYRDQSRELSRVRDAEAMIEAMEAICKNRKQGSDGEQELIAAAIKTLQDHKEQLAREWIDIDNELSRTADELKAARDRIDDWHLDPNDFDAARKGLKKTYKRACKALATAIDDPTSEKLHELRKRTKYHWYHMRLLEGAFEPVLSTRSDQCKLLSDYLGDDHDLSVLTLFILDAPDRFGDAPAQEQLMKIIQLRRQELQSDGMKLAKLLYAESPKKFVARITTYWENWRDE